MYVHGLQHSHGIPKVAHQNIADSQARPIMKGPDQGLTGALQMVGGPDLHIFHHTDEEKCHGDAMQDAESDGHLRHRNQPVKEQA